MSSPSPPLGGDRTPSPPSGGDRSDPMLAGATPEPAASQDLPQQAAEIPASNSGAPAPPSTTSPASNQSPAGPRGTWRPSVRRYKVEGEKVVESAASLANRGATNPPKPPQGASPQAPVVHSSNPRPSQPAPPSPNSPEPANRQNIDRSYAQAAVNPTPVSGRRLKRMLDEDISEELNAALSNFDVEKAFIAETPRAPSGDGHKDGRQSFRVLDVRGGDVFVNVGGKSEGVISGIQFEGALPAPGDFIEAIIEETGEEDIPKLRLPGASQTADWSNVAKGMIVEAQVKKVNKGGLEVLVNNIRGFMPAGQASLEHLADLSVLVNQTLRSEVTEANPSERNLVVSRKAVQLKEREEKAAQLWVTFAEGQVLEGVVKRIQDFGAFVDVGGVDGLLHIGQMSWTRIKHPGDLLTVGQSVKVQIVKADRENRKLSLSLKQMSDSPWTTAGERYSAGKVVRGTVSKVMEYGAFVELEPAVEGLIHVSELSSNHVRRVGDVVREGQEVEVKVLSFDFEARRISLSMKQATPEPELELDQGQASTGSTDDIAAQNAVEIKESPKPKNDKWLKGGLGGGGGPLFG